MARSIELINADDFEEILTLAKHQELQALARWPAIPRPGGAALRHSLERVMQRASGVVSRQDGKATGYLLTIGPIPEFRPGTVGVYSPLAMCGIAAPDIDTTFTALLRGIGELSAFGNVNIAALTCFTHQPKLDRALTQNGFGVRCADSVVAMSDLPVDIPANGFSFELMRWQDALELLETKQSLARHLASSPMHMEEFNFSPEFVEWKSEERQSVYFVARAGNRIVGFIEATEEGENYLTRSPEMRNICGAAVLPEYRGQGIMQALLVHLANSCRQQGIRSLGVDYETINPEARWFWEHFFTPYTWSWERRFDTPWGSSR